jgi:hypothetical protein
MMVVPALAFTTAAGAAKGGNSANAKACQKGGWQDWVREDRTPFANQDECVSYGAKGGTLTAPLPSQPCYDAAFPDLSDIRLTGPIDTLNNLTVFGSTDGSCQGPIGTRTVVDAGDQNSADAKCAALDPATLGTISLSGPYGAPFWWCQGP